VRRLVAAVALGSALVVSMGAASAAVRARAPARARTYQVVLKSSGDEYEGANNMPINGTDGTKCPPSHDVPSVKAKCWTWSAKGLGHGTFTQANLSLEPGNFTATFTYTDTHGNKLTGTNYSPGVQPDPTPPHTVGHVNRFPGSTDTFTGGTGKFRGVSGTLTGDGQTVVLSVDPATGIAHKRGTSTESGTLTFPRKL
jgi:hypothetical protein